MRLPPHPILQGVLQRPSMYFQPVTYDTAVAYLYGFDAAMSGGALIGLREWLIVRLGFGNDLAWSELMLHSLFPNEPFPRNCLQLTNDCDVVQRLFHTLMDFFTDREPMNGLRMIYARYSSWLEGQEWYDGTTF
jgi:hypothetical protein